jgi:hypothetical protein
VSLRIYTVHLRRPVRDQDKDVVLVKEGFSWPAFLFSGLWALWNRLWLVALGLCLDPLSEIAISIGFALLVGFVANDLRRWTLAGRGYFEADVVAAPDALAAELRFYEHRPTVLADLKA